LSDYLLINLFNKFQHVFPNQMKPYLKKIIIGSILLVGTYLGYRYISEYIEEKRHKEWVASLEHSISDNVQILKDTITIDYLDEKRTLAIYLPEGYEKDTINYPVIYFLDGQSLFDQKILEGDEWQVDEVLDSLGQLGREEVIVVGIYNSDKNRLTEYKPFTSPHLPKEKIVTGDKHAKWIVTDLKEWIDAKYRTKKTPESTIIGGASLGGLMAYYMLMTYPDIFGGAIVFSPSFWVRDDVYRLHEKVNNLTNKKIYFNAGELETPTVESIQKMHGILKAEGIQKENLMLDVEKEEGHWHMTWRKGFKKAYPWILRN